MKKFAISLLALAAVSTVAFADQNRGDLRDSDTYFGKYSYQVRNESTSVHALAVAKKDGRDRTQIYDARLGQITQQRINADERLRRALEAGAIDNNYQPILETATGAIVAMETLIRLADDNQLPLRPFEILRAAKDTGLLGQVDMHVLTQACATIAQWTAFAPELVMTLNLHIKQFRDPKLTMAVAHATKRVGLSTENLGFEVDQSILADMNEAFEITQRLQGMGVKIYIEAFQGSTTASSSIAYSWPRSTNRGAKHSSNRS